MPVFQDATEGTLQPRWKNAPKTLGKRELHALWLHLGVRLTFYGEDLQAFIWDSFGTISVKNPKAEDNKSELPFHRYTF